MAPNGTSAGLLFGLLLLVPLLLLLCFVTSADAFLPAEHPSSPCKFTSICGSGAIALPAPSAWSSSTALPCQLLGMNCRTPTDFSFSFRGFARRGGDTDIHRDGWGVAWYEGKGLRSFHDPNPASDSPIAKFVSEYPVLTLNMIAHIRYGTEGKTELANVHPFDRELWGIRFVFAHNGDVPMYKRSDDDDGAVRGYLPRLTVNGSTDYDEVFFPVGDTDSEAIFCAILNALRAQFQTLPSLPVLHDTIRSLCNEIVEHDPDLTILNFLMGCGENVQFAFSWPGARPGSSVWNGLHYLIREPPFSVADLEDLDYSIDFSKVATPEDRVAVIATKPLTSNEEWVELRRGELILFDDGLPHLEPTACFDAETRGHGLKSKVLSCPSIEEDRRRYGMFQGAGI
jgi:predicted glutamine amidotransferase